MIALLLQSTTAPLPMPQTYGEGFLIVALCTVSGVAFKALVDRAKRAEGQVDALTASLPELLMLLREWKEADRGRTPKSGA